ncbi:hypothetical protein GGR58DRAFT_450634 [Xylaria digitata]|nr:hypothetical protein GGR58DRAFT_450634 [Xylaria digitata]
MDHLSTLLPTSLATMREVADILSRDEIELDSRSFYLHLNARCHILLGQVTSNTPTRVIAKVEVARNILSCLDSLLSSDCNQSMDISSHAPFSRLKALNQLWKSLRYGEQSSNIQLVKAYFDFRFPSEQQDLLEDLKRCEDVFRVEAGGDSPIGPIYEPRSSKKRREPSYVSWLAAQSLFQALEASRECPYHPPHIFSAMLCIETHRDHDLDEEHDFNMFLAMEKLRQEVHVRTLTKSQFKFVIDDGSPINKKEAQRTSEAGRGKVRYLCGPINKIQQDWPTYRLKFLVENGELWKLKSEQSNFVIDQTQDPITLQRFITEYPANLTEKTKRILAVLLGYAALHLHGTSWLQSSWGPENILFLKTQFAIPLKPYIELQFSGDTKSNTTEPVSDALGDDEDDDFDPDDLLSHPFPSLVSLAAILIQIHMARTLQSMAQDYGLVFSDDMNQNVKYFVTTQIFERCRPDISEQTRAAINECLSPSIGLDDDGKELDDYGLRSAIYIAVICRLELELEHAFSYISIEKLDTEARSLDLAKRGQLIEPEKIALNFDKTDKLSSLNPLDSIPPKIKRKGIDNMIRESGRLVRRRVEKEGFPVNYPKGPAWRTVEYKGEFGFFEDRNVPTDIPVSAREAYISWKKNFSDVYDRLIGNELGSAPVSAPVKIAVLDTGIDESHPYHEAWKDQIRGTRSFLPDCQQGDTNVFDYTGHGTHVAGLLLAFAPDAELYVAKIADLEPPEPATIAKAIDHAINEWQVDMISMSFGFPSRKVEGYEDLSSSLNRAKNQNILLFAAASNNGANSKRGFPARHEGVICIHSTNANGIFSGFNPTPIYGINFATIGEAVESNWPANLCNREINKTCVAYKSGTSFATPIATGIAAFLLQYARLKLSPKYAQMLKQYEGMKAVLKAVAIDCRNYHYIAPSLDPDNFFGKDEDFLQAKITDALLCG